MKKILVPGGTGAMGVYLVPELLRLGYKVDVISLDDVESDNPNLRYFKANFKDEAVMTEFLQNGYDGIIDFMIYHEADFRARMDALLSSVEHYVCLSSYRVYANEEHPITERSPRLLDVNKDPEFIGCDPEYSLYKARIENILNGSKYMNWTILRPSITFSKRRFQLVTLEAPVVVAAAKNNVPILLPKQAMDVQATMTWAGDVAKLVARLMFNPAAMREVYHPATSEHNTWQTIADYYKELIGLKYFVVDKEDYLCALTGGSMRMGARWQLEYDRLFDRVMDNSKILNVTGMKQSELTPVYDALKSELAALPAEAFAELSESGIAMAEYCVKHGLK